MGWSDCGTDSRGRPIGYGYAATCDLDGCETAIDRGLAYACGGNHGFGEWDCDGYFCGAHLVYTDAGLLCVDCAKVAPELECQVCGHESETAEARRAHACDPELVGA